MTQTFFFKGGGKITVMPIFLSKPNDSACTVGPIPSHLLKHFSSLCLMPVFQVLFTEKLFKGSVKAHFHLFPFSPEVTRIRFQVPLFRGKSSYKGTSDSTLQASAVSPQFSSQLSAHFTPSLEALSSLGFQAIALCGSLPASPSIHALCPSLVGPQ